ncbi:TraM recognition domain-containing protein [Streptomyces kaniharaensis]|uniref:TraM recognition domain-containing protein n=1 Tax=Streptomyces kaniharaensis TaxID=212423 RepID=A0A6N7L4V6_9ACTN|nr:type IV secretory system conjugative DNA transfer family protein [Streptomyces kaniharaensis]MQS17949.1 TraM recognition domain-containing protein [Streptomyces kaniharaensis]
MHQFDDQATDRRDDRPTVDGSNATPPRRWAAYAAAGMPLAAGAAPTGQPTTNPTTVNTPNAGHILGNIGSALWDVAGHVPGGHLGAGGLAVAAAGLGYLKFRLDKPYDRNTKEGFADRSEIREHFSGKQLLERADVLRPELVATRGRRNVVPLDLGQLIGVDIIHKREIYNSIEDMTLVFAPPRTGKSALLGGFVVDAPGSAVVTSTRGDLYRHTVHVRAKRGPVLVFNPDVAGVANTLVWDVPKGCKDPVVAFRRAGYLLSGQAVGAVEDSSFWDNQSYRVLRALLMAADIGGRSLMDVREWVTSMDEDTLEPFKLLQSYKDCPPGWASDLLQVIKAPERTRESILLTLISSLECLALPSVAAIVTPKDGAPDFDPELFLRAGGTLYLMGRHRSKGSVAPLFAALVGEIYETAKELAASSPNDRIDPPLSLILDEAAITCPLPLQSWGADAGGSNIPITVSVQSPSQLYDRWGQRGGETIWQLANKLVFGGLSVTRDLRDLSELCGERDKDVTTTSTNAKGEATKSVSTVQVPVMPTDKIRRLAKFRGLYIHRNAAPVVVKIVPVWKRDDVKAVNKEIRRAERDLEKREKQAAKLGIELPTTPATPPMPAYKPVVPKQPVPEQQPGQRPADPFRKAV